eukprot:9222910-Pyramimonas_sp.AAC.1
MQLSVARFQSASLIGVLVVAPSHNCCSRMPAHIVFPSDRRRWGPQRDELWTQEKRGNNKHGARGEEEGGMGQKRTTNSRPFWLKLDSIGYGAQEGSAVQ